jgi:hypothetical protein
MVEPDLLKTRMLLAEGFPSFRFRASERLTRNKRIFRIRPEEAILLLKLFGDIVMVFAKATAASSTVSSP